MRSKDLVFIHGWGEDSRIWNLMAERLPEYNHHFVDLGFIGDKNDSNLEEIENAIFLTHSLGSMWALKHIPLEKISAFAAINGFGRFTDFVSLEVLEKMSKSLHRNIKLQMQMFWKNCNLPENMQQIYGAALNRRELSYGLSWLGSWDERSILQDLKALRVPVISLGSRNDLVLPREIMKKHWEALGHDVVMNEEAGHALPLTDPVWCAGQIKGFLQREA